MASLWDTPAHGSTQRTLGFLRLTSLPFLSHQPAPHMRDQWCREGCAFPEGSILQSHDNGSGREVIRNNNSTYHSSSSFNFEVPGNWKKIGEWQAAEQVMLVDGMAGLNSKGSAKCVLRKQGALEPRRKDAQPHSVGPLPVSNVPVVLLIICAVSNLIKQS